MPTLALALPGLHRVRRGAETAMESLACEMAVLPGWDLTLFGSGDPIVGRPYRYEKVECPAIERYLGRPSVPLLRTPAQWQEWTFARALRRATRGRCFNLTLACSWPWTHFALKSIGSRHAFWTQNGDHMIATRAREYRLFDCDGLICTNPDYYTRHRERYRSVLLPNGVDPARFSPGARDESLLDRLGLGGERPVVLVVTALEKHKRVENAVRAAALVGDVDLVICGDGAEHAAIDRLGAELLGGRYRRLTLPREQMPGLYRCADVLLHPCESEPSANVWSEALASGLPVVANDMAVTRWVLGPDGHLCDGRDPASLANALRVAISSSGDGAAKEARHASARERLSWTSIAAEAGRVLDGLLPHSAREDVCPERTGAVVIGRNEGARLVACLESMPREMPVVYVDSGSTDGSRDVAAGHGAMPVELGGDRPFTAARARNAGLRELRRRSPGLERVLFVDGDTRLISGFLARASHLLDEPSIVGVAGRRRESHPGASVFNRLCDQEWNTAVGSVRAIGGDALYQIDALAEAGGFNESLIAGEEPELALRLRRRGHRLARIACDMTLHDAAMVRLSQWWRRHVRAGHAYAEGRHLHGGGGEHYRISEVRSIVVWAGVVPAGIALAAGVVSPLALLAVIAYPVQMLRVAGSRLSRGDTLSRSVVYGLFTVLAKWPQLQGVIGFHLARVRGKSTGLIEYKRPAGEARRA